ncbi:MAG: HAD hydrolase-like protein [Bacteroidota bacterium]
MSQTPKTLVIFDVDGTLVYSETRDSQCFARTYQTIYGKPFPTIDWNRYPDVTDTVIFDSVIREHFQRAVDPEEVDVFQHHFVQGLQEMRVENPQDFRMVPAARDLVDHLHDDPDMLVGLATGGWRRPALFKLDYVGVNTEPMYKSFADGKYTRSAIIEEVLEQVGTLEMPIQKVVYIGDASWDVRTTRAMQMPFVGIRWRGDHATLQDLGAQQVITDYQDFGLFKKALDLAEPPA